MTAPTFVRALTKKVKALRAEAFLADNRDRVRDLDDAINWLSGRAARADHVIETRQRDGVWRHILKQGSLGFSAANPIAEV